MYKFIHKDIEYLTREQINIGDKNKIKHIYLGEDKLPMNEKNINKYMKELIDIHKYCVDTSTDLSMKTLFKCLLIDDELVFTLRTILDSRREHIIISHLDSFIVLIKDLLDELKETVYDKEELLTYNKLIQEQTLGYISSLTAEPKFKECQILGIGHFKMVLKYKNYVLKYLYNQVRINDSLEIMVLSKFNNEKFLPTLYNHNSKWSLIEFIEGITLKEYLHKHRDDLTKVQELSMKFSDTLISMIDIDLNLFDLHPDNIIINSSGELFMIDCDIVSRNTITQADLIDLSDSTELDYEYSFYEYTNQILKNSMDSDYIYGALSREFHTKETFDKQFN